MKLVRWFGGDDDGGNDFDATRSCEAQLGEMKPVTQHQSFARQLFQRATDLLKATGPLESNVSC